MSISAAIAAERERRRAARRSIGRFDFLLARVGFRPCPDYEAKYHAMRETNIALQQKINNQKVAHISMQTANMDLRRIAKDQAGTIRDLKNFKED